MSELEGALRDILDAGPDKITLSAPRQKDGKYRRAVFARGPKGWRAERFTATQAFHAQVAGEKLLGVLAAALAAEFTQLVAFSGDAEHSLRVTKKGKILLHRRALAAPVAGAGAEAAHNRQKNYLLANSGDVPALRDMGLFTAEGRVAAPMQGKYRQINRFLEQVDDAVKSWGPKPLHVIDFGCGKSYLTFVLYHYLTKIRGIDARITGLDLKADVVQKCSAAAEKYGYDSLRFAVGDIAGYAPDGPVDMVVTLHACDTATDYALAGAIHWGAQMVFSVPCCQHELNAQMRSEALSILTRYGLIQERAAALFTDAVRANLLTACGYKTQVLEFVDMEHTPKNILLRAVKRGLPLAHRKAALREVERLMEAFSLSPTLYKLLAESGALEGLAEN